MSETLLVVLSGVDRPGVTARVLAALPATGVGVLDVEQVVIRERLVLGLLLGVDGARVAAEVEAAARAAAAELGLEVDVRAGGDDREPHRRGRTLVTVLGAPLRPAGMAGVAERVAALGGNIDRVHRLSARPVTAVELEVSGADPHVLRDDLAREASALGVGIAVQRAGLHRRGKQLVVMDVDSTLVQGEVIELLAERAGCADRVAAVTEAAMRGELDFAASLHERVALLAGLDAAALDEVRAAVRLTPGARTLVRTLQRLDHRIAVVSGGFTQVVEPLAAGLGIDYVAANALEVVDGRLTGRVTGEVVDRAGKAAALERFAAAAGVPLAQTVAIGDGANDLDMLARAGLGIAFNAKPVVRAAAHAAVPVPYLDAVLSLLGIPRSEVEAADAADARGDAPGPGAALTG